MKSLVYNRINKLFVLLLLASLLLNQVTCAQETVQNKDNDSNINRIKLQAVLTPPYIIGPGDELTIVDRTLSQVFGHVEQFEVVVSADGYISIPLPDGTQDNILAAGSTLKELSTEVRNLFSKTLINPLVFVQISRYRPINVYIGGEVVKPGVYKIETAITAEKGGQTTSSLNTFGLSITQAIQLAGGLKPRANIKELTVTRGINSEQQIVDLTKLLTGVDTSQDINLQPGDAIFAKAADNVEDQAQSHVLLLGKLAYQEVPVSVEGEVKLAGNFLLPNDATLIDAIGMAGGLNEVGSLKLVRLSRYDEDGIYRTHKIDLHDLIFKGAKFDDIAIRPNDRIELIASKGKETRHFFRDIASNVIATTLGAAAGTFGGFIVQDNMFNRLARLQSSSSLLSPSQNNNAITIFGNSKGD